MKSALRVLALSDKIKRVYSCPLCGLDWTHGGKGVHGSPPKLCPTCRVDNGWCSDAKHVLPLTEMSCRSRCRECTTLLSKRQQVEKREWLKAIKLKSGCVDCGFNLHHEALDFDHMPEFEKSFNLGLGVTSRGWPALHAEVAKCEVRCANCHRIKTAERANRDVTQTT